MTSVLEQLPRPTALVCGYGERNAAASAGMISAVAATGWQPDFVVGSSLGALTAAAAMVDPEDPGDLAAAVWSSVAASKLVDPSWTRIAAAVRGSEGARVSRTWRELLAHSFGDAEIPQGMGHAFVGTDLTNSSTRLFTSGLIVDALMSAAAFPLFTNPQVIDGDTVVDGGFAAPIPVLQAAQIGAASIVVLHTGRPLYQAQPLAPTRWFEVVLASVRSQVMATASHDLATAGVRLPIVVFETPRPGQLHWSDVAERMSTGRRDAERQLAELAASFPIGLNEPGIYATALEVVADRRLSTVIRAPQH